MKFLCLVFSLLAAFTLSAQPENVYTVVEQMPMYGYDECKMEVGSDAAALNACCSEKLMEFLGSITYPEKAIKKRWEGKVFIRFIINQVGAVTDIEVARSSGVKVLDDVAIRHLGKMDNWEPGVQDGKKVKVQYVVPINFKL